MPIRVKGQTADRHPRREWNSPERRKERQQQYMDKHGARPPRRKRLTPGKKYVPNVAKSAQHPHSKLKTQKELKKITDSGAYKKSDYKGKTAMLGGKSYARGGTIKKRGRSADISRDRQQTLRDRLKDVQAGKRYGRKSFAEYAGGSEKAKPHSTKKGRIAAGSRKIKRLLAKWPKKVPDPRHTPGPSKPIDPRSPYIKDRVMIPLRAKKAVGGVAKGGLTGIKRLLHMIKTGKDIDKHGTKVNLDKVVKRLKKQGSPGIESYFESTGKHPKGKASGGRIGLKKGSVHKPGSHSWYLQHMTRPKRNKKAEGGRIGYQSGGRTRLLEELGRVEAEPSNRNRRAEISRVHGELNRGYKSGGAVLKGKKVGIQIK